MTKQLDAEAAMTCPCGAPWIACAPGTAADARVYRNVVDLRPEPEVPARFWCEACWRVAFPGLRDGVGA